MMNFLDDCLKMIGVVIDCVAGYEIAVFGYLSVFDFALIEMEYSNQNDLNGYLNNVRSMKTMMMKMMTM